MALPITLPTELPVLRVLLVLDNLAVRVTLEPKSKCVLADRKYGRPSVCNDGVTIAK